MITLKKYKLHLLIAVFVLSHVLYLTRLPVFADEAIYIRWGQLFGREPAKYLFFPLYDGKTPLFIWLLGVTSHINLDPLWVGRAVSVLAGLVSGLVIAKLTYLLSKDKRDFTKAFLLWTLLPFSFLYSRLALIDMLLTMWLAISFMAFIALLSNQKRRAWHLLTPGFAWGLALITKTSALYFLPVYGAIFIHAWMSRSARFSRAQYIWGGLGFMMGAGLLAAMAVSPLFPFLFQRSADFTFSLQEIITSLPHILMTNTRRIGKWLFIYGTPGLLFCASLARAKKPTYLWLFTGLLVWLAPFLITGRVLSSRYILPSVIFIVPLITLSLNHLKPWLRRLGMVGIGAYCVYWNYFLIVNPNAAPFPIEDRVQFLTDWSSGHGIKETADFLLEIAKTQKVLVATEGFFGSLPDGLMIYLDGRNELGNMRVEGVGLPIFGVPQLLTQTPGFDRKFVVVNEHRFVGNPLPQGLVLVQKYARPYGGPSLLLLEFQEK